MKVIALERERPGVVQPDYAPHLEAEARAVRDLLQRGIILEIHFRADLPQAVIMLEAETIAEAELALNDLPLVRAGLIEFEFIGLKPYPGFARLGET
jgi:hypothetical protein